MPERGNIITIIQRAATGARNGLRLFYRSISPKLRLILIVIGGTAVLSSIVLIILGSLSTSPQKIHLSKDTIATQTSNRLRAVVGAISNLRDTLALDSLFTSEIQNGASEPVLFTKIHHLDSLWQINSADVFTISASSKNYFLKGKGVAYYTPERRLLAWDAAHGEAPNFDSVYSYAPLLEKHSKTVLLDNEQLFTWIVATRKIISKDGGLLGFIIAKSIIGERFPIQIGEEHLITIFDDILKNSGRDAQFVFSTPISEAAGKTVFPILLDPADSASHAGYLLVGDPNSIEPNNAQKIIGFLRDLSITLFIFIFFWLLAWYLAKSGLRKAEPLPKLFSALNVLIILFIARILLSVTGSYSAVIPQTFQDPQDFSMPSLFGLLSDPLQLATTVLFISCFLALLWVIFVPERPEWSLTSEEEISEENAFSFSTAKWLLKIVSISGIILLLPIAIFLLRESSNGIVSNGSFHYTGNRYGFTKPSFVMMEASLLLTGLSFLLLAFMILLWAMRSMIRLTVSELSPSRSYIAHYIFFTTIAVLTSWGLSPNFSSIYPEIYWAIIVFLLCITVIIIFVRDLVLLKSDIKAPSLFYRIPRSGLSILFMLCAAGFFLSPLIASQEYSNEVEIVRENLRQNSQINTLNYYSYVEQAFLSLTTEENSHETGIAEASSDIRNLAFNIWLEKFGESTNNNILIQVQNTNGKILSHFAQNVNSEQELRLSRSRDSLIAILRHENSKSFLIGSEPCFTSSCTPAAIGVGYSKIFASDSLTGSDLLVTIAMWNDFFSPSAARSLYDIVRSSNGNKFNSQNQQGYYAEYHNDILQNSSASLIELPSHISSKIDSAFSRTEFPSVSDITQGNRSYTIFHKIAGTTPGESRIIAATLVLPGWGSVLNLALSLNSVSLFIGFFVIFFAIALRSLFSKGKKGALKFRDRIFLIVLTIALVPLVIVTNITRRLLIEREQRIEREHLERDADIVAGHIQPLLVNADSATYKRINLTLDDLSRTIGRDISLYNDRGILIAANRPELYESSLLTNQLSPEMAQQLLPGQKTFAIEPLTSASGNFDIGYKAIERPGNTGLAAVVGVTSFRGEQVIAADISRTIELMYGAFSALGILLLLIGAWISVRVAAPLQQLIGATERVAQGRLETIVDIHRRDEVGELAQAFNRMTRELERTRENVAQSEREGAWKEMARQVAHEIKNPLTPMKLSIQHVSHSYEASDTNFGSVFKRVIRTLSEQIEVLTRIATEFSRFGEMPRRKYAFVSLKKIAESAVALYDAERGRIRFVIDIPNNLPPIFADDEEFRRALVNLTRNALQATEGWGIILIRAREKNGLIHLDFTDTGGGMTPETLRKAFDPNFSTKTSGMGLGLAIVKKIITDMSGTISVESQLGKGTTFHIELPAREYPNE